MFNIRNCKLSKLFIIISLLIAPVFLAACEAETDSAAAAPGLRELTTGTLSEVVETSTSVVDEGDTVVGQLPEVQTDTGNNGNGQARVADRSAHVFDPNTAPELSQEETDGLVFMREEEKLARDVYLALYEQWGVPVFQNIAGSEQAHMDSVLMLLEQYGLTDPAAGLGAGEFSDPNFQSLYNDLVAQGSLSQADALIVGATIEDLDISDLQVRLAQTENEYIVQVYNNLLAGSENHLRAFVSSLERQGATYVPQFIDQAAYEAILNGSSGQGNGQGGSGQGGNGQGGNGQGGNGQGGNGQGGNGQGGNGQGGNGQGGNGQGGNGNRGGGRGQNNNA